MKISGSYCPLSVIPANAVFDDISCRRVSKSDEMRRHLRSRMPRRRWRRYPFLKVCAYGLYIASSRSYGANC